MSGGVASASSLFGMRELAVIALATTTRTGLDQQYNKTQNGRQRGSCIWSNQIEHTSFAHFLPRAHPLISSLASHPKRPTF
jgi:hypothetical protein